MSAPPGPYESPRAGGGGGKSAFSPAVVAIISVLGSAFLVVSYYRIFAKLCTRWQNRRAAEMDLESQLNGNDTDANASPLPVHGLDETLIKKIPIFEYKRGDGFTVETECPVCLMDFNDKQELRMLPKCAHAFHVLCIDTWLSTNSTCPLCRANIFSEQVMSQYPHPLSPPQLRFFGTPPRGGFSPVDYSMGEFARINNGHGRSPAPTLRGLLNFEDHQQHHQPPLLMWASNGSESGRGDEPGEDSIRLYDARDYGGDSSARHHGLPIPASGSLGGLGGVPSAPPSTDPPPPGPQQGHFVTRTASFKEGLQRSRSGDRDHKWHMHPARRSSSRRNPFASVRSFSMGTSRRLVNALEFLDLEGMRSSSGGGGGSSSQIKGGDKMFSPYEYGITETPDYHSRQHSILTVSPAGFPSPTPGGMDRGVDRDRDQDQDSVEMMVVGKGGSSSDRKEILLTSLSNLRDANHTYPIGDGVDHSAGGGAAMKSSSGRAGARSLSFRSPFSLKRSLSGGRNVFSLRYSGRSSRIYSSSTSPPRPSAPTAPPPVPMDTQ